MASIFQQSRLYLILLYASLTGIVGFQIARILYYRHALYSFQLGFLLLCFVWGVLRVVFWSLFYQIISGTVGEVLLWIPLNFQFATFSLLVVFYAHLVHKNTWEKYTKKRFTIAYITVNTILLIMQCVCFGLITDGGHSEEQWASDVQSAIAGLVFLILVTILSWYGWKLNVVIRSTAKHQMLFQVPPMIFVVTFVITLLFISRCIFDFMNIAGKWVVEIGSSDDDDVQDQVTIFVAYFLWEIVPTVLIVLLFWRIPTTHIGGLTRRGRSTMFMLPPSAIKTAPSVSRLFNDPQRYDSDDETTGFLHRGSPATYSTPPQPSSYTYTFGKNAPYSTTPRGSVESEGLGNTPDSPNKPLQNNNGVVNTT